MSKLAVRSRHQTTVHVHISSINKLVFASDELSCSVLLGRCFITCQQSVIPCLLFRHTCEFKLFFFTELDFW